MPVVIGTKYMARHLTSLEIFLFAQDWSLGITSRRSEASNPNNSVSFNNDDTVAAF
jgi:hypothetical protein